MAKERGARPIRLAALAGGLAALTLGCSLEPPTSLPAGAQAIEAPAIFQTWWARTEACSGLTGNYAGIQWYVVPGANTFQTDSGDKVGFWIKSRVGTRIILAGDYRDYELVVRHEMLHELLGREGHPPEYFQTRCHLTWDSFQQSAMARR